MSCGGMTILKFKWGTTTRGLPCCTLYSEVTDVTGTPKKLRLACAKGCGIDLSSSCLLDFITVAFQEEMRCVRELHRPDCVCINKQTGAASLYGGISNGNTFKAILNCFGYDYGESCDGYGKRDYITMQKIK